MKKRWSTYLHWPWAQAVPAANRTEELTIAATRVVAQRLWRYNIPESERERFGKMRNLQETLAAIRYRQRIGKAVEATLLSLARSDDALDLALSIIEARGSSERVLAQQMVQLRQDHRTQVRSLIVNAQYRWPVIVDLNQTYLRFLDGL